MVKHLFIYLFLKYLTDNSNNCYTLFFNWPCGCLKILNLVNILKNELLISL